MNVGDMVKMRQGYSTPGLVVKIDSQFYGANTAYKVYKNIERGKCIRTDMVDGIGPTRDGIRDRVMILWSDRGFTYEESKDIEVVNAA